MVNLENGSDLIVFSSNQYGSDEVRTSQIMNRFLGRKRVYFFESPIIGVSKTPTYFIKKNDDEMIVVQPYLPGELSVFEQKEALLELLKELMMDENIYHYSIWTDTPRAMAYIRKLNADVIVYDCLQNFSETNPELEHELFQYADVVLTSGLTGKIPDAAHSRKTAPATFLHIVPGQHILSTNSYV